MKKIIFVIGMLTLVISCKMPNDYSDTDVSNQIENPSSEIEDEHNDEENEPSNPIEDEEENSSSEITDDEEIEPSNPIEDDSESNEANCCEIDENITLEELMNFKYFIRFGDKEELSNDVRFGSNNNGTHYISIRKSIDKTVFYLHVKLLNGKLYVENNSNNYSIKTVRIENNNEVHIEF